LSETSKGSDRILLNSAGVTTPILSLNHPEKCLDLKIVFNIHGHHIRVRPVRETTRLDQLAIRSPSSLPESIFIIGLSRLAILRARGIEKLQGDRQTSHEIFMNFDTAIERSNFRRKVV